MPNSDIVSKKWVPYFWAVNKENEILKMWSNDTVLLDELYIKFFML